MSRPPRSQASPAPAITIKDTASTPYEENAYAVSQGQRLFTAFNCVGCHSHGGGGIGPALMDEAWIYGDEPENIFATIVEGRPNGMPSFRGRLGNQQVWQLVAYVRSLSGKVAKDVAPGRADHMYVSPQEQETRDTALHDSVESVLVRRRADIDRLLARYAVPRVDQTVGGGR